jgi:hypothetical protein
VELPHAGILNTLDDTLQNRFAVDLSHWFWHVTGQGSHSGAPACCQYDGFAHALLVCQVSALLISSYR